MNKFHFNSLSDIELSLIKKEKQYQLLEVVERYGATSVPTVFFSNVNVPVSGSSAILVDSNSAMVQLECGEILASLTDSEQAIVDYNGRLFKKLRKRLIGDILACFYDRSDSVLSDKKVEDSIYQHFFPCCGWLKIELGIGESIVNIFLPRSVVQSIFPQPNQYTDAIDNVCRVEESLGNVQFDVQAVLTGAKIKLEELKTLSSGDVLDFSSSDNMLVSVVDSQNRMLSSALLGAKEGYRAVRLFNKNG
jgi:flagellar motor switch/type III secretory pathway protein FliN